MNTTAKRSKKRLVASLIILFCLLALCFVPVRMIRNDGGTVEYCAVFYRYIVWNEMDPLTLSDTITGTSLYIFPFNFESPDHGPNYPE